MSVSLKLIPGAWADVMGTYERYRYPAAVCNTRISESLINTNYDGLQPRWFSRL